ncbi:MAG: hypothetical protein V4541_08365 [Bacteroidota bacterium]
MITEGDKELDDLFKERLADTENSFAFNEDDWVKLEAQLDKKDNRRKLILWIRIGAGAAAMLLLFFGWMLLKPISPKMNALRTETANETNSFPQIKKEQEKRISTIPSKIPASNYPVISNKVKDEAILNDYPATNDHQALIDSIIVPAAIAEITLAEVVNTKPLSEPVVSVLKPKRKDVVFTSTGTLNERQVFAVGFIAASDINGVNSLKNGKVGRNYGLLFSARLTRKISIQTGISYAVKPYEVEYNAPQNPYSYKVNPWSSSANCQMLDIPLNINYEVFSNAQNKFAIGTGFSSYVMLRENYRYNYPPTAKLDSKSYIVPDSKSYLWSMLNVNATYEHQLNSRFGIIVQPYLKIPVRDVGYSSVKLHSAGVSVGLNMNIARSTK